MVILVIVVLCGFIVFVTCLLWLSYSKCQYVKFLVFGDDVLMLKGVVLRLFFYLID